MPYGDAQNYVAKDPYSSDYMAVVGGTMLGYYPTEQAAQQAYNAAGGPPPAAASPGSGSASGSSSTPPALQAGLGDLQAAIASGNLAAIQQAKEALAETAREYDLGQRNSIITSLMGTASKLTGPRNYAQFEKYTGMGRELSDQLTGAPRAAFSNPSGHNEALSLRSLLKDLGLPGGPVASGSATSTVAPVAPVPVPKPAPIQKAAQPKVPMAPVAPVHKPAGASAGAASRMDANNFVAQNGTGYVAYVNGRMVGSYASQQEAEQAFNAAKAGQGATAPAGSPGTAGAASAGAGAAASGPMDANNFVADIGDGTYVAYVNGDPIGFYGSQGEAENAYNAAQAGSVGDPSYSVNAGDTYESTAADDPGYSVNAGDSYESGGDTSGYDTSGDDGSGGGDEEGGGGLLVQHPVLRILHHALNRIAAQDQQEPQAMGGGGLDGSADDEMAGFLSDPDNGKLYTKPSGWQDWTRDASGAAYGVNNLGYLASRNSNYGEVSGMQERGYNPADTATYKSQDESGANRYVVYTDASGQQYRVAAYGEGNPVSDLYNKAPQEVLPGQLNPGNWDALGAPGQQTLLSLLESVGWDPQEVLRQINNARPLGDAFKGAEVRYAPMAA